MSRLFFLASLVAALALSALPSVAGARSRSDFRLTLPAQVVAGTATAIKFDLPGQVAAVDGRVFFDALAAEVIGVAPAGAGMAMTPQEIAGGAAFGAYGLAPSAGRTQMNLIVLPKIDGTVQFRVVIDAAADRNGLRMALSSTRAVGDLMVGRSTDRAFSARDEARLLPVRAATGIRDVVADGVMGKPDLDVVRVGWELARTSGTSCSGFDPAADANGDGCVDVVDMQAVTAMQGRRAPSGFASPSANDIARPVAAAAGANLTFVVTSTMDTKDATNGDGLCADSQGRCTLRAAITESNWQSGDNRIEFNLPGTAPVPIQMSSNSMAIIQDRSGKVVIDGYTQPGSRVNTATVGSNAIPGVELRGTSTSSRDNGFFVTSANNVIRGFLFTSHYRAVYIDGVDAHDNYIVGNLFGFTANGAQHSYHGANGIRLNLGAHDNHVGTADLADRNVIGNFTHAVDLYGPGTNSNNVQGNVLCMTPSGGQSICSTAIDHNFGPKNNLHGGTNPGERNVIGPTSLNGIEVSHGWDPAIGSARGSTPKWQNNGNRIIGNWIGFRADGSYDPNYRSGQNTPNSNDANGVNVYDGSNYNIVDGNWIGARWDGVNTMSPTSSGNIIRNNIIGESPLGQAAPLGRYGINVRTHTKTGFIENNIIRNAANCGICLTQSDVLWFRISRNIVTDTAGPAIYLQPDANNPSTGANNLLASPVITAATTVRATGTGIAGSTVEVFRASRNSGQSGLPVAYLGSAVVAPNGTWSAPIVAASGERVTALQINSVNNTSALGTNVTVTFESAPPAPVANFTFVQRPNTLTVDFTDTSANTPAQWSWTFGDGTTSISQNPSPTYAAPAVYTVTLTATNGGGSSSMTQQVTVQPPAQATTYASDAFGRSITGWGSADLGGAYTLQGNVSSYNVANGVGTMSAGAGNSGAAMLNTVSQRDVDILVRVNVDKVATGGNYIIYAVARRNTNNEYRPRITLRPDGTVAVNASVVNGGSESSLGALVVVPGLTQAPNSFIWLRAQVTGSNPTTISVKAWADGQAEPAAWQFTATNSVASVQVAGAVGMRTYLAPGVTSGPVVVRFDDYTVRTAN